MNNHRDKDVEHHGGATCSTINKNYFLPFFFVAFFLATFFLAIMLPPFIDDKFTRCRKRVNDFFQLQTLFSK